MDLHNGQWMDAARTKDWIERELRRNGRWRRDIDVAKLLYEMFLNCRPLVRVLNIEALLTYRVLMSHFRSFCYYRVADTPSAANHLRWVIDRLRDDESELLHLNEQGHIKGPRVVPLFTDHLAEYPVFIEDLEKILRTEGALEARTH